MNRDRKRRSPLGKTGQGARTAVTVWEECVVIPTYWPGAPDKNPMFLEKRVYQGSSGKVYPLPFTDRINEKARPRPWKAVWIENEFLRVMVLPELGGRIHRAIDKTNGYDFIYYQPVIKPALVGLAGPWVSGGIEFNWPQHHRPATFLPVEVEIEEDADGAKTVWCGDHDPMTRMSGRHGVCLHPGRSVIELKVRAYNRTLLTQTFLWWANVATRVHEGYQSFFPPDVYYVADHARRSMSEYPIAKGFYYGVNFGERGRKGVPKSEVPPKFVPPQWGGSAPVSYSPSDLSFYANIPTPCSYMGMGSKEDFFGGYDHFAQAGLVHVANHHIAPGKKQWTWGNHPFGYAWDRNLTDADARGEFAPYIELMAGVFTDNQPDFSFLAPGETKSWSQFWYPIQKIGPAQHANVEAALSLHIDSKRIRIGVSVASSFPKAVIRLERENRRLEWDADLAPGKPFVIEMRQASKTWRQVGSTLHVLDRDGNEIIAYSPRRQEEGALPPPASEPPVPRDVVSADELFVTGLHLEQYRHATRCPTLYWCEALRRDPLDSRCNNALGLWHLRRGEFSLAEGHFRKAIQRITLRNANPYDGEPYYNLGLCLRYLDRDEEAYDALYKATWNQDWSGAAYHGLAEIDCCRHDWVKAGDHLERSARHNSHNLRANNLWAMVVKRQGNKIAAAAIPRRHTATAPLDWWARHLAGEPVTCDLQTCLDLAHDYARAGFHTEAIQLLNTAQGKPRDLPDQSWGAGPLIQYTVGWLHEKLGDPATALKHYRSAAALPPDYCFPSRLEEIAVLESAMRANRRDARAPYYLGNLLYDRRRHEEAIRLWERSAKLCPNYSVVWRNLGIGYFNCRRKPAKARAAYDRAFRVNPVDARLLYERDQLWKRVGETPARRLSEFEKHLHLVRQRDDLSVELCALYNQTGQHVKALQILAGRRFQPWEGGEGQALGQHVRTHLALGRTALAERDFPCARDHFENALRSPENLGEAKHLLANQSDIHFWLGCAWEALGEVKEARAHWQTAAAFKGDFQEMSVRTYSEMTYYSALAWKRLDQSAKAKQQFRELIAYAHRLARAPAKIDYFATSLPTMLLFEHDLHARQVTAACFLEAQARLGLGQHARSRALLEQVLERDPNHPLASDLKAEITL